jgi:DNA polymerase
VFAIALDTHVASGDAAHRALFIEQQFRAGKTGKNIHAQRFGLGAQPAAELAEADDVIAVILEALRQSKIRHVDAAAVGEKAEAVAADRRVQRRVLGLPIGD